jgi:L-amino acid N-acyltransferase
VIRPARDADAAALADIWRPIIRDTTITFTTTEKSAADLVALMATRRAEGRGFLVAERAGGAVLGFATYGAFRAGPGYARAVEHTVVLAPEARGQGLGRALMLGLMAQARDAGAHTMIGGVSGENQAGADFHAALGFDLIARLPEVGYKFGRYLDLLLYQKILT